MFGNQIKASNWLAALSGVLGGQLSIAGEPHAAVLGVVCKFLAIYGTALRFLDRGRGIRFVVPYTAVVPVINPLMILPLPIEALDEQSVLENNGNNSNNS